MPNRLAAQTSPYLLQHADQPVDWYPWGEDAFAQARRLGRPILLSIGYSSCHWCHVMAHESFEDEATAALMNAAFINVKVDREARPDLDQIYQLAHQALNQRPGGWPLTVFMTPAGEPFLAATYIPRTQRHGLPSFKDVLQYVAEAYPKHPEEIATQIAKVSAALSATLPASRASAAEFTDAPLSRIVTLLDSIYDTRNGGLGQAPKFPHTMDLWLLLRLAARSPSPRPRTLVLTSLSRMAAGGIFDQLGGGFFRYSVDAEWNIPHFEKMLYDNGLLLRLYAEALADSGDAQYRRIIDDTVDWAIGSMQAPAGGFYSAQDADSEGGEGAFYLWTRGALEAALDADEYAVVARHYGLNRGANFEGTYHHLYIAEPLWQVANSLGLSNEACQTRLDSARAKLRAVRSQRPPVATDIKILPAWNGLMIAGLARAAAVCGQPAWIGAARRALGFIRNTMWREGRLAAVATGKTVSGEGFLDDYALMLAAVIELLQVDFDLADLAFARALGDALIDGFEDREAGGFFFTRHDFEPLIHRAKPALDLGLPGGNGVAAWALQRLAAMTGEARYAHAATRTLEAFFPTLQTHPAGYATLSIALLEHLRPPRTVVLRGPKAAVREWAAALGQRFAPDVLALAVGEARAGLPVVLNKPLTGAAQAWVCEGAKCLAPRDTPAALAAALGLE